MVPQLKEQRELTCLLPRVQSRLEVAFRSEENVLTQRVVAFLRSFCDSEKGRGHGTCEVGGSAMLFFRCPSFFNIWIGLL